MNISALWVFVFAVMSARVYAAKIPCSDCNNPCPPCKRSKVKEEFKMIMTIPQCRIISNNGNPKWKCIQSETDLDRTYPHRYSYAKCEECENGAELKEISQNFTMLFRRGCKGHHNHTHTVLELQPVTVSLGCMCVKT